MSDTVRDSESERDIVGDKVTLFVALLLFAASNRFAAAASGGSGGGGGAASAKRKARATPAAAPALALSGGSVPTRRLHCGRVFCDAVVSTGRVQMRKTRSARLSVNLAGGTRSRLAPSADSAAARQQEAVMTTLDDALETSVVPRSTARKVTLLSASDAGCPLPRSALSSAASVSVTLVGAAASPQMKLGASAPVCASTTATTMSGSGVVEMASLGTNADGGENTLTEKLAVCRRSGGERSGEFHSWHTSCTVTFEAVGPASLNVSTLATMVPL